MVDRYADSLLYRWNQTYLLMTYSGIFHAESTAKTNDALFRSAFSSVIYNIQCDFFKTKRRFGPDIRFTFAQGQPQKVGTPL